MGKRYRSSIASLMALILCAGLILTLFRQLDLGSAWGRLLANLSYAADAPDIGEKLYRLLPLGSLVLFPIGSYLLIRRLFQRIVSPTSR
jgi:hypothetical protein